MLRKYEHQSSNPSGGSLGLEPNAVVQNRIIWSASAQSMVKVKLVVTGRPPGWAVVRLAVGSIMPQATAPNTPTALAAR
jgi:hypothetical protein